jgi:hypothetical protein
MNERFGLLTEKMTLPTENDLRKRGLISTLSSKQHLLTRKKMLDIKGEPQDLLLLPGITTILGESNNSSVKPIRISTRSVDEFKNWIGRPDKLADTYPWDMPSGIWNGKLFRNKQELTEKEISDIEKAGWIYLFNNSQKVASYSKAIENYHGKFEADLYHLGTVVIQPRATLIVKGIPSVLLINKLEIQESGTFIINSISQITIGALVKSKHIKYFNN